MHKDVDGHDTSLNAESTEPDGIQPGLVEHVPPRRSV
jgi:hypothetical protein